ncbi:MAG: hypothetical protein KDH97_11785 [Calditrichaeota bacterium]|nr:hypothetical protein [Calditrichota bacterium]MCB0290926.1 hypothetical protein [Calditrichota bacterium]MCB0312475.1 hypothetical protein [Calditrichota bacterium]MCB9087600.1 hypothetical protein [Calditrichia bacterium]
MGTETIIPALDPMPLPAPFWLFKLLLVLTFFLHIVVMNFMFGGGLIAAFSGLFRKKNESDQRLFKDIVPKIPSLLAATITLGIAPLLFVQVLYGQFFYTATIIMAWPWFLVLVLLMFAYYGFYIVALKQDKTSRGIGWVMLISIFFIFLVGFFYSSNFTLMESPATWSAKYFQDRSGWNLNGSESTLIPRFLHFLVASVAVGSFLIILTGLFRWKQEADYARFLIVRGGQWFMYATMTQFVVGIWFLISLPREAMLQFMGGNMLATISLLIGVVGGLAAIFIMSNGIRNDDPRTPAWWAMGITGVVVIFMAMMRDVLRTAYLSPYFKASELPVKTQLDVLILFLVLFVIGILVWALMIKRYFFTPSAKITE